MGTILAIGAIITALGVVIGGAITFAALFREEWIAFWEAMRAPIRAGACFSVGVFASDVAKGNGNWPGIVLLVAGVCAFLYGLDAVASAITAVVVRKHKRDHPDGSDHL